MTVDETIPENCNDSGVVTTTFECLPEMRMRRFAKIRQLIARLSWEDSKVASAGITVTVRYAITCAVMSWRLLRKNMEAVHDGYNGVKFKTISMICDLGREFAGSEKSGNGLLVHLVSLTDYGLNLNVVLQAWSI